MVQAVLAWLVTPGGTSDTMPLLPLTTLGFASASVPQSSQGPVSDSSPTALNWPFNLSLFGKVCNGCAPGAVAVGWRLPALAFRSAIFLLWARIARFLRAAGANGLVGSSLRKKFSSRSVVAKSPRDM